MLCNKFDKKISSIINIMYLQEIYIATKNIHIIVREYYCQDSQVSSNRNKTGCTDC
jgi:hypothetical protein